MIKSVERAKMKRLFKTSFINEVLEMLNLKGITNKKGQPYSKSFVCHVFNGRNSNEDIEDAFFELYKQKRQQVAKKTLERKNIMENKNPEAGTPGSN